MTAPPGGRDGWQPTPEQELLVAVAFGDHDQASEAFERWVAATGFDVIDDESFQVLPLVAHHLDELGVETPQTPRLRGILRRNWLEHQMVLQTTVPALEALQAAGIDPVVQQGAALAHLAYTSPALRPVRQLDLLVRDDRTDDALATLGAHGWRIGDTGAGRAPARGLSFRMRTTLDGVPLTRGSADGADDGHGAHGVHLRWHATDAARWRGADDGMWASTRPCRVAGTEALALRTEDELLVTCLTGARWHPVPRVHWIVDAITLVRHGDCSWDAVGARAEELHVEAQLAPALTMLAERFAVPVPEALLAPMSARRASRGERARLAALRGERDSRWLPARLGRVRRAFRPRGD